MSTVRTRSVPAAPEATSQPSPPRRPSRPTCLGPMLPPRLLQLGEQIGVEAKAEWRKRVAAHGGRALFAPLSEDVDPKKPLLVVLLGIGFNPQDAHAISKLKDSYQIVLGLYDETKSGPVLGTEFAEATQALWRYRQQLGEATGVAPDRELRLVGHSYGGYVSMSLMRELEERGLLQEGEESPISKLLFVGLDNPWRGLDLPNPEKLSEKWHEAIERLNTDKFEPQIRRTLIATNLFNGTRAMRDVNRPSVPPRTTIELASAMNGRGVAFKGLSDPVNNFFSAELAPGELQMCWDFFKSGNKDLQKLRGTSTQRDNAGALRNLLRMLALEDDGADIIERLGQAAKGSFTLAEFGRRYDAVIESVVTPFTGDHTWFMENKEFLPWLSATLEDKKTSG